MNYNTCVLNPNTTPLIFVLLSGNRWSGAGIISAGESHKDSKSVVHSGCSLWPSFLIIKNKIIILTLAGCYHGDQKLLSSQADCCSPLSNQLLFQHRIFTKWKYEPLKSFPLALICEKEECHETLFIILRQSAKNMLGFGWWYFLVTMVFGFWTCSYFV